MSFNPSNTLSFTYTYTVTPKLVELSSPGPTLTLDSSGSLLGTANPVIIQIGDLTGVLAWTYPFIVKAQHPSDSTQQASYIIRVDIRRPNHCDCGNTATVSVPTQTNPAPYYYLASTFQAAYTSSDASCDIEYTCVTNDTGPDLCLAGTLDASTGVFDLTTTDASTYPPGPYDIIIQGHIAGFPEHENCHTFSLTI